MKFKITAEMELEDILADWTDVEEYKWTMNHLKTNKFILHCNDIGDTIGNIKIENIEKL